MHIVKCVHTDNHYAYFALDLSAVGARATWNPTRLLTGLTGPRILFRAATSALPAAHRSLAYEALSTPDPGFRRWTPDSALEGT